MAWGSNRSIREELHRDFPRRVPAKCCHCGRSLGLIYGDEIHAIRRYVGGLIPQILFLGDSDRQGRHIRVPVEIRCHPRCGKKYVVNQEHFHAAYRAALAKPEGQQVLRLPYDLKPVAGGKSPMRLDSPLIGR